MCRCWVPPPPPIILETLKLPQQIIYRPKENLSESPNHQKYWENILVSQFYEQFSRNRRNLGHFRKFEKFQTPSGHHGTKQTSLGGLLYIYKQLKGSSGQN